MSLPTSRDVTYAPDSKVLSNNLNNIQDQFVGDKHISRPVAIPACAFKDKGGGSATLGDGQWTFAALTVLVCEISSLIPVGHRLQSVSWYYNRGGAGTITRRVRKREMTVPGAAGDVAGPGYPIADVTGAAQETNTDTLNYTMVTAEGMWLEIQFDNAAHVFTGAQLTFDKL
jgi:hypothetical protein